jgi:hypothetical protein
MEYNEARRKYQQYGNHDPNFASVISKDETEDSENYPDYAAVLYLRKHLEERPGLNELVVRTLDGSIAMESTNISKKEIIKRRDCDVSSIYSSGNKKRKKNGVADTLFEIAKNKPNYDLDKIQVDLLQQKEDRLNEKNDCEKEKKDCEKEKMYIEIDRIQRAHALEKEKMKVDYLESLCTSTLTNNVDFQKYIEQLKEAREKYLD